MVQVHLMMLQETERGKGNFSNQRIRIFMVYRFSNIKPIVSYKNTRRLSISSSRRVIYKLFKRSSNMPSCLLN